MGGAPPLSYWDLSTIPDVTQYSPSNLDHIRKILPTIKTSKSDYETQERNFFPTRSTSWATSSVDVYSFFVEFPPEDSKLGKIKSTSFLLLKLCKSLWGFAINSFLLQTVYSKKHSFPTLRSTKCFLKALSHCHLGWKGPDSDTTLESLSQACAVDVAQTQNLN